MKNSPVKTATAMSKVSAWKKNKVRVYIDTAFVITLFLSHGRIELIFEKVQYLYRSASEHDGSHFICHAVLFPM